MEVKIEPIDSLISQYLNQAWCIEHQVVPIRTNTNKLIGYDNQNINELVLLIGRHEINTKVKSFLKEKLKGIFSEIAMVNCDKEKTSMLLDLKLRNRLYLNNFHNYIVDELDSTGPHLAATKESQYISNHEQLHINIDSSKNGTSLRWQARFGDFNSELQYLEFQLEEVCKIFYSKNIDIVPVDQPSEISSFAEKKSSSKIIKRSGKQVNDICNSIGQSGKSIKIKIVDPREFKGTGQLYLDSGLTRIQADTTLLTQTIIFNIKDTKMEIFDEKTSNALVKKIATGAAAGLAFGILSGGLGFLAAGAGLLAGGNQKYINLFIEHNDGNILIGVISKQDFLFLKNSYPKLIVQ